MRPAALLFRRHRFARLFAVVKAAELLLDDAYGSNSLAAFRVESESTKLFDDLVEHRSVRGVSQLHGWQIKQQTTDMDSDDVAALLRAADAQRDLTYVHFVVAEMFAVRGAGPIRALRDVCRRLAAPGASSAMIVSGATIDESQWLSFATSVLGSEAQTVDALSRLAVHIVGDEDALFERSRGLLPGLYNEPIRTVIDSLETFVSSIDGTSVVTERVLKEALGHLAPQQRTLPHRASRDTHRAQFLTASAAKYQRTAALANILGAGASLGAPLSGVYVTRRVGTDYDSRTLSEWLEDRNNAFLVVTGEVGSGKSTLLAETQNAACIRATADSRAPLPLLIRARDLASETPVKAIAEYLEVAPSVLAALFQDPLTSWLLLVDGVDEVTHGAWGRIERISTLLELCGAIGSIVVTTRPVSRAALPGYRMLQLEPWDEAALDDLLAKWQRFEPSSVAHLLNTASYDSLRHTLLLNPLMASLCLLLAKNGRPVPLDRTRIFMEALELLFEGWRQTRIDCATLHWHQIRPALGRIALGYLKDGMRGITASTAPLKLFGGSDRESLPRNAAPACDPDPDLPDGPS